MLAVLSAVLVAMVVLLGVAGGTARGETTTGTVLTLNASPAVVKTGSTTNLFGELSQKNGGGIKGKRVVLQQKPHGAPAGDFQPVAGQPAEGLLTGSGGEFSLPSVKPDANTDYRARFAQGSATTTSRMVEVGVKVDVGLQVQKKNIRHTETVTMLGKVSEAQTEGTVALAVRRDGQKFTKRVPLVDSAFVLAMSPKRGKYTVSATYAPAAGQTDFMGNKSLTKKFNVR